jgi:flagellum-specific ATP synthase
VLQSVSRLAPELVPKPQWDVACKAREALATYKDAQDLIQVGAYVRGSDPRVDEACTLVPKIEAFLRQPVSEGTKVGEAWARLQVALRP